MKFKKLLSEDFTPITAEFSTADDFYNAMAHQIEFYLKSFVDKLEENLPDEFEDVGYDRSWANTDERYDVDDLLTKISYMLAEKFLVNFPEDTNESLQEKLVPPPQEVVDELIEILGNYDFVLDSSFKFNPGKTIMGNTHLQVINPNSYVDINDDINYDDTLLQYIPQNLIDDIHELDQRSDCPITWNFGPNEEGKVTGGLDIDKQYIEESLEEGRKDLANKIRKGQLRHGNSLADNQKDPRQVKFADDYDSSFGFSWDEDDDTEIQIQDRYTNNHYFRDDNKKFEKHPRVSSNAWGRVWKNGELEKQFEGPKYIVRQDMAKYLDNAE